MLLTYDVKALGYLDRKLLKNDILFQKRCFWKRMLLEKDAFGKRILSEKNNFGKECIKNLGKKEKKNWITKVRGTKVLWGTKVLQGTKVL